jgi:hypothetical protein
MFVTWGLGVGPDRSGTAGAWAGTNYISATGAVSVIGTLNATWYITGVQFEVGSVATPFERRPFGTELALCQRYYYRTTINSSQRFSLCRATSTTAAEAVIQFPQTMRTSPTALEQTGTAANYNVIFGTTSTTCSSVPTFTIANENTATTAFTVSSGLTAGNAGSCRSAATGAYLGWSAEL